MQATQVLFSAKEKVILERIELPTPGPKQVLVQTLWSVISPGTELAVLHELPNAVRPYPYYPGYAACARVIEIGSEVQSVNKGQTVALMMPHCSAAVVDEDLCRPIDEGVDLLEAAAFRLASISLQGVRKGELQLGQATAVVGLGVIGHLAGQLAKAAGSTWVVGIDPVDWRRELAMKCGYDAVCASVDEALEKHAARAMKPRGFDVVLESTGVAAVVNDALKAASRMGRVVLLGSSRGVTNEVNFYSAVHARGIWIIGAHEAYRGRGEDIGIWCTHRADETTILKLLAGKRIQLRPLINDVMPAQEIAQAYQRLSNRREKLMTIGLNWQG